jgi:hypothetical protein
MPIHDWTRVEAGIFHAFHHDWITEIARALNRGLLPPDFYALPEQIAGGLGPDILTLRLTANGASPVPAPGGGIALAEAPPRVRFHVRSEPNAYAAKAKAVVVRHTSRHQVIAMVEIVSPGNKNNQHGLRAFVREAVEALEAGVHLLIVDLFPPGPRNPQGIHPGIWEQWMGESDFHLPPDAPLTMAAHVGGDFPEAFIEPAAVGSALPQMPLFLTPEVYIRVPLQATYQSAWEGLPAFWRGVLDRPLPVLRRVKPRDRELRTGRASATMSS